MNGAADTRPSGDNRVPRIEHLPTPSLSPEPHDVASSAHHSSSARKNVGLKIDVEVLSGIDSTAPHSESSSSRRPSAIEEAILSDSSERSRPRQIKRPGDGRRKSSVSEQEKILKLSPKQIHELTHEPASIPMRAATPIPEDVLEADADTEGTDTRDSGRSPVLAAAIQLNGTRRHASKSLSVKPENDAGIRSPFDPKQTRPPLNSRALTTPPVMRRKQSNAHRDVSPMPASMPLPPFSMPTFLSLELARDRPSPLYIYRSSTADFPYESSEIKYDRLVNFLKLPQILESVLGFGALACLDAWMHILTILPLRFLIAIWILVKWWGHVVVKEMRDLWRFVFNGVGRVHGIPASELKDKRMRSSRYRHRRTKSTPSALLPSHKADILKGLLVIASSVVLMHFDASRMYHGIRGQAAIKLYVIYNVLEVFDRLFSALGQDVLECLFSRETLDRNPDGRSKIIRPLWMFCLALVYNVVHAAALFYQVITLNVAVNSYSNALLTLLMSNQFVEIKGTVFKRFEKENLFQLTCSDIVERFQLWLMLLIIAMRNIVEVGGLSIRSTSNWSSGWSSTFGGSNSTAPFTASSIVPLSFTVFPKWIGQVLNPFLLVLGSEMVVDWLKHAYITKFNQTKPEVYGKFLDVLAKDYYSNAFQDQNLTRRLGLPVLPLSCLFIRAAIQTYHMFIATHMPAPLPSTATSLAESATSSHPATTAALAHIDQIFRRALGRSTFGAGVPESAPWYNFRMWTLDDAIAFATMAIVFGVIYLLFLAFKLILGMLLLRIARNRYHGMKERERLNVETGGKRIGGWGVVDVDEDKRRWIYNDDAEGLRKLRERDERERKREEREREQGTSFGHVSRYAMVAKRIW
ncbi:DUF747-domain-containing protein [Polyplosphaeria fusca]|uniref:DUF747-domain-containing protein n=1 Tax=Polyplosphaeria fusca TaxID=682080 RepID=A0A9P4V7L7_9PLEO|nr:DUF747-domain-containing protein [Polyplosphaeria fusca]